MLGRLLLGGANLGLAALDHFLHETPRSLAIAALAIGSLLLLTAIADWAWLAPPAKNGH